MRLTLFLALFISTITHAFEEELIVTGFRQSGENIPAITLIKQGDFLIVEARISNDTRDKAQRHNEIYKTLRNIIEQTRKDKNTLISYRDGNFVVPLNRDNYKIDLNVGTRPDTNSVNILLKTQLPKDISDPQALIKKLRNFSAKVPVVGRSEIKLLEGVEVSIVAPDEYRSQIIKLITDDIKSITASLGEDYRVVIEGFDRPIEQVRVGATKVALYIPYQYTIIPKNISSYLRPYE